MKEYIMNLDQIQPSQLYISSKKLENVLTWFKPLDIDTYEALPVKLLSNRFIFTDGHTRAFAAYLKGASKIKVYTDEDDLDWEAYDICVNWCISEGITSIGQLKDRVISMEDYKVLWLEKCRKLHEELAELRGNEQV